jgi:AcrR family transcriptional regulator
MTGGDAQTVEGRPLPRGPHRLAREQVVASQRGRMLDAIAQSVAAKGYTATTVGDVVSRAGVSRKTFYEHFTDKEECFLAAYDTGVEVLYGAIDAAGAGIADPIERMRAGVRAHLATLAAEPHFARSFLIEIVAAGPRAEARRAAVHERFAERLAAVHAAARRDLPSLPEVHEALFRASVGAFNELVTEYVREERTAQLGELEDTLLYLELVLFAGHELAARATAR